MEMSLSLWPSFDNGILLLNSLVKAFCKIYTNLFFRLILMSTQATVGTLIKQRHIELIKEVRSLV